MSTLQQNKEIVIRFNKEFIEGGNVQSFHEIIAGNFINHTAPPGRPKGPEGVLYFFNELLRPAFPDLKVEIYDQVAEGDKVTTRKAFFATHKGDFFGVPASGNKVVMNVIDIIRLENGKFVEHWNLLDWQSVMMQITSK
jgi:predicted ester cyclase